MSPSTDDEDHDHSQAIGRGNENGNGHGYSAAGAEDEDEDVLQALPKKRVGYFDLHPDRRPARPEDPGRSSTSGYGDSIYSEGDFEPTSSIGDGERQVDGDIEVPAFVDSSPRPRHNRSSVTRHAE